MQPEESGWRLDLELIYAIDEVVCDHDANCGPRCVSDRYLQRDLRIRREIGRRQSFFRLVACGHAGTPHEAMSIS